MIDDLAALAVIPARGGSKGVPRKNLRIFGGKPLIAWTIEAARRSGTIDRVIVSTDDPEIAEVALAWGGEVPFMRPPELATDEVAGDAPFRHAVKQTPSYDLAVLLQPTSPLRNSEDIDGCVRMAVETGGSVVSVCEAGKHPAWMYTLEGGALRPVLPGSDQTARRQDLPPVYALNGAIYVIQTTDLEAGQPLVGPETRAYVMPQDRSVDIDGEVDLKLAAIYLEDAES